MSGHGEKDIVDFNFESTVDLSHEGQTSDMHD